MLESAAFLVALSPDEIPRKTAKYQGFFHPLEMNACVETVTLKYMIRDHHAVKFKEKKRTMTALAERFERAEIVIN
jgi:tripeptide aminopeptidase